MLDPSANTQLMGLYRSGATYCTQCEAEGFRRITYFLDRPDVMAVYTTRIEADRAEAPVLLANGNLVAAGDVAGTARHFAIWHDPFPKPSYLFALVGGELGCVEDRFVTMSGREVELRIYVEPGKEDRCAYAMDALKRAMRWDEEAFGREYDLDIFMIVAVSDFNMGAMENKGLNVFNDKYVLATPETATDADFAGIEAVIAHEYFHNWTGNRITCRDWFQLCLKEGLDGLPRPGVHRRPALASGRSASATCAGCGRTSSSRTPGRSRIRCGPRSITRSTTSTPPPSTRRAPRSCACSRRCSAPEHSAPAWISISTRHDGEAATVEHFVQCFADVGGRDLDQFMLWYSQAGTPEVVVAGTTTRRAETYRLEMRPDGAADAGPADKEPMVIPLALGLVGRDGRDLPLTLAASRVERGILALTKSTETFDFTGVRRAAGALAQPRLLGADPAGRQSDRGDDLRFLAAHDNDPFNRWQAVQMLAMRLLIDNVAALRERDGRRDDERPVAGARAILADAPLEPAFVAQVLIPPGEADIAREIGRDVDPDAIFAARAALRAAIGERLGAAHCHAYERMPTRRPLPPDAAERRPARAAQRLPRPAGRGGQLGAIALAARAVSGRRQHDRPPGRARDAVAARRAGARAARWTISTPAIADDPLIVDKWLVAAGGHPGAGDARARPGAHRASGLLVRQSQPGARPDRRLRDGEPDPVQPRRRCRLRFPGRHRAGARPQEPAGGGAPARRPQELARARARPPRAGASRAAARRGGAGAVARRARHRRAR